VVRGLTDEGIVNDIYVIVHIDERSIPINRPDNLVGNFFLVFGGCFLLRYDPNLRLLQVQPAWTRGGI
jgi:hypothetical protein